MCSVVCLRIPFRERRCSLSSFTAPDRKSRIAEFLWVSYFIKIAMIREVLYIQSWSGCYTFFSWLLCALHRLWSSCTHRVLYNAFSIFVIMMPTRLGVFNVSTECSPNSVSPSAPTTTKGVFVSEGMTFFVCLFVRHTCRGNSLRAAPC